MQNGQGTLGAGLIRVLDAVVSAALIVLFSPFFLAIAILIKVDSPGPVFFLQERVGQGWPCVTYIACLSKALIWSLFCICPVMNYGIGV